MTRDAHKCDPKHCRFILGLGPVFLAQMIVHLGGRTPAFNVGVLGWIFCGALNLFVFLSVVPDQRKVQARLRADLCRLDETEAEPDQRASSDHSDSEQHELT